jgi:mRNA-degrading endonuclease toxin of MazEF toxin-antitoxin module
VKDQFDVWRFVFPKQGEHSVVLISHPDRCARAEMVNVLYCTSQRQNRKPYPHEVMLDMADGFDWETFCDCTLMYSVASAELFGKRGRVTLERRRAIREKIRDLFLLMDTD